MTLREREDDLVLISINHRYNAAIVGIAGCLRQTTHDLWARAASRAISLEHNGDTVSYLEKMVKTTREAIDLSGSSVPSALAVENTTPEWMAEQVAAIQRMGAYDWALEFLGQLQTEK